MPPACQADIHCGTIPHGWQACGTHHMQAHHSNHVKLVLAQWPASGYRVNMLRWVRIQLESAACQLRSCHPEACRGGRCSAGLPAAAAVQTCRPVYTNQHVDCCSAADVTPPSRLDTKAESSQESCVIISTGDCACVASVCSNPESWGGRRKCCTRVRLTVSGGGEPG